MISRVTPAILISIWSAVIPSAVPATLKVHIAQMILVTENITENPDLLSFFDQAHRNAGDRGHNGDTGVHQGKRAAAHRGHGGRAV